MQRIIEIVVSPAGETTVQSKGFTGQECLRATQFLEQALGIATQDVKTAEFFAPSTQEQQAHQ